MKRLLFAVSCAVFLSACSDATTPSTNTKPIISEVSATPQDGVAPLVVTFTVQASDPDGDDLVYNWDFDGDAQIDIETREESVQYEFDAGTYEVGLEVSDGNGGSAITSITVSARDPF